MKVSYTVAVLTIGSTHALAHADEYFTGDGTAYTLGDTSSGNCNMMSVLSFATTDYAALNNDQWNGLQNCGRCAEVSCADSRCSGQAKSVVVQILDRCPECKHGDLDLSPSVFKTLTGSDPSRYTIKWKFVDCPVPGNVNYCLKGGSNNYWTAIQPTTVATGITSLQINGKATKLLDGAYYYLLDGAGSAVADLSSVTVSLTDLNGVSMKDTLSLSAGSCTKGSSQFPSSSGDSSPTPTTASPKTSAPAANTSAPATAAPKTPKPTSVAQTIAPTHAPIITTLTPTITTASPSKQQQTMAPVSITTTPVSTTIAPKSPSVPRTTTPASISQSSGSSNDEVVTQTAQPDIGSLSGGDPTQQSSNSSTGAGQAQGSDFASGIEQTQQTESLSGSASENDESQGSADQNSENGETETSTATPATNYPSTQQLSSSTESGSTQQQSTMASEEGETHNSTNGPDVPATVAPTEDSSFLVSGSTGKGDDSQTTQQQLGSTSDEGETTESTVRPTVTGVPSMTAPTQQSGSNPASEDSSSSGEDDANQTYQQDANFSSSGNVNQDVDSNTNTKAMASTSTSSSTMQDDEDKTVDENSSAVGTDAKTDSTQQSSTAGATETTQQEPTDKTGVVGNTGTANCPM